MLVKNVWLLNNIHLQICRIELNNPSLYNKIKCPMSNMTPSSASSATTHSPSNGSPTPSSGTSATGAGENSVPELWKTNTTWFNASAPPPAWWILPSLAPKCPPPQYVSPTDKASKHFWAIKKIIQETTDLEQIDRLDEMMDSLKYYSLQRVRETGADKAAMEKLLQKFGNRAAAQ